MKPSVSVDVSISAEPYEVIISSLSNADRIELNNLESLIHMKAGEIGDVLLRDMLVKAFVIGAAFTVKNPAQVIVVE